ncbi:hypothetical protein BDN72DRAFT_900065 [Pluteus cervinus]|uniref:Uncharacterized protein n=1 Tax=Pluteus cervinus TaxID=181527 RepID=A0ACD3ALK7_9AGAR|nr:hypothetical protein BDN72DRAFT_900065 [Pluteus cervinus]
MVQISARFVILGAAFGMTMASPIALSSQPQQIKRTSQGYLYMASATQATPAQGKYLVSSKRGEERAPVHVHQTRGVGAAAYETFSKREGLDALTQAVDDLLRVLGLLPKASGNASTSRSKQAVLAIIRPDVNGGDPSSFATQSKDITDGSSTIFLLTNGASPNDRVSSSQSKDNTGNDVDGSGGVLSLTKSEASKTDNVSSSSFSASRATQLQNTDGPSPGIAFLAHSQTSKTDSNVSSSGFSSSGTPVFVSRSRQPVSGATSGKSNSKESSTASFNFLTPQIMAVDR